MQHHDARSRWIERSGNWHVWLADVGLDGLVAPLSPAIRSLSPLAAQLLWIAQPALGAFSHHLSGEAGALARILDDPDALDHLLTEPVTDTLEDE